MTTSEYFALAMPTREDFAAWTRWLFAWADALNARLVRNHPQLFKTKNADGDLLPNA